MTLSTHTAIGALIGGSIGNPLLGFIIGFISHLLVDMIPHGDAGLRKKYHSRQARKAGLAYVSIDGAMAILLLLVFFNLIDFDSRFVFTAAVAGSVLPDILVGVYELTKQRFLGRFVKMHVYFHDYFVNRYGDVKLLHGIVGQTVFLVILIHFLVIS